MRIAIEAEVNTRGQHERSSRSARPAPSAPASRCAASTSSARAPASSVRSSRLYPTNAAAQDADMSLAEYEDFVYRAGLLDHDDPVAEWDGSRGGRTRSSRAWLGRAGDDPGRRRGHRSHARRRGADLGPLRRPGELPRRRDLHRAGGDRGRRRRSASRIRPAYSGRRLERHRARVPRGRGRARRAPTRASRSCARCSTLDDGARHVGEFAFGLNEAITEFTGAHALRREDRRDDAPGARGLLSGVGRDVQSALHWDLVCDLRSGSEVYADGEVVYRDGRFVEGLF